MRTGRRANQVTDHDPVSSVYCRHGRTGYHCRFGSERAWAEQVVVPVRNIVPLSGDADPLQLSMLGINPVTAYLLLSRYLSLMPGDWIGQTAANSAIGQYIIKFAKLAGVKTLNVVRREEAADQVRQFGGDHGGFRHRPDCGCSDTESIVFQARARGCLGRGAAYVVISRPGSLAQGE